MQYKSPPADAVRSPRSVVRDVLSIDDDRLRSTFEAYSEIGATDAGGLDRLSLTDADRAVRDRFVADLEALGIEVQDTDDGPEYRL